MKHHVVPTAWQWLESERNFCWKQIHDKVSRLFFYCLEPAQRSCAMFRPIGSWCRGPKSCISPMQPLTGSRTPRPKYIHVQKYHTLDINAYRRFYSKNLLSSAETRFREQHPKQGTYEDLSTRVFELYVFFILRDGSHGQLAASCCCREFRSR
jgi:hypothetical protein